MKVYITQGSVVFSICFTPFISSFSLLSTWYNEEIMTVVSYHISYVALENISISVSAGVKWGTTATTLHNHVWCLHMENVLYMLVITISYYLLFQCLFCSMSPHVYSPINYVTEHLLRTGTLQLWQSEDILHDERVLTETDMRSVQKVSSHVIRKIELFTGEDPRYKKHCT